MFTESSTSGLFLPAATHRFIETFGTHAETSGCKRLIIKYIKAVSLLENNKEGRLNTRERHEKKIESRTPSLI